eukprot:CAMPEP_0182486672 /NCGR_PEP_ID=MMETSP1319-20130603/47512_1 /TAXON_ID=172717 /ORGANISM="Bolidomonas pacifica, Strain RCC208" /LENGTH=228 /DNA_ID=CAMNT_0024688773 /DNA_START=89 /DNA_END=771 /DNA_ORIENTATION=+
MHPELGRHTSSFTVNHSTSSTSLSSKRNFDFNRGSDQEPGARRQGDWENDDFMDSLSRKQQDDDAAGDEYDDVVDKRERNPNQGSSGGSSRFKAMMEMKNGGGDAPPRSIPNPVDPSKHISSTSDLYLEQLKADTRQRKKALFEGDMDTFNAVWTAPEIAKLKEIEQDNPFRRDLERKQAGFERDETFLEIQRLQEEDQRLQERLNSEEGKASRKLSYKERLDEAKAR